MTASDAKMREAFIGQCIEPVADAMDASPMATGAPALARSFVWSKEVFHIETVLRSWKETSPCRHGSDESYVRKHWYEVRTTSGAVLKIYFERQARSRAQAKKRWWLFSLREEAVSVAVETGGP